MLIVSGLAFYAPGARPDQQRKPTRPQQSLLVDTASVQSVDGELIIETTGEVPLLEEDLFDFTLVEGLGGITPRWQGRGFSQRSSYFFVMRGIE